MPAPPAVTDAPPPPGKAYANANHLWAALLIEELVRQGVTHFVVGPGSRSTPLAVAAVENPRAEVTVSIDERGGAFFALGVGRATGLPAAWITTSGTAVANGLPAAVEADAAGVPLLLLTADRPPELRDTGANQTVRQRPLFASVARWSADLAPPTPEVDPAYVLTTAAHAVARARGLPGGSAGGHAGPVHLNCPFREPLAPREDGTGALPEHLCAWASGDDPYVEHVATETAPPPGVVARAARALSGRVLLVAGEGADPAACQRAARENGWVLLADTLSGARCPVEATPEAFGGAPTDVPYYDLVLASEPWADAHVPDAVVHVGARPTSKRLQTLIDRAPITVRIAGTPGRLDPAHRGGVRIVADPGLSLDALAAAAPPARGREWSGAWRRASGAVAEVVQSALGDGLSEPRVAQIVGDRAGDAFVVAASMPIRDVDTFAPRAAPVFANRGASGIDGTVATAAGVARGVGGRATLLIGDLAMLHDLNSLALLRRSALVTAVVINNDGGGIFHFLPVARGEGAVPRETFERVFGTPHGLGFREAAALFGLTYHAPETPEALERALAEAEASGASALIEVRTEREANAALHREIARRAAEAVGALLP